jgi:hypothetical protein
MAFIRLGFLGETENRLPTVKVTMGLTGLPHPSLWHLMIESSDKPM